MDCTHDLHAALESLSALDLTAGEPASADIQQLIGAMDTLKVQTYFDWTPEYGFQPRYR